MRMKIISPAYRLPNSRSDSDTGLEMREIPSRKRLTGARNFGKGWNASSPKNPPAPFTLML